MLFIGLDLAWRAHNYTGAAALRNHRLISVTGALCSDQEITEFVAAHLTDGEPAVIAVDAPLCVPNEEGARLCDRQVSAEWGRFEAGALPANRRLLAEQGVVRGEALVATLAHHFGFVEAALIPQYATGRYVCEVFPHPAHVSLFGLGCTLKYKARKGRTFAQRYTAFRQYQKLLGALREAEPALLETEALLSIDVGRLRGKALKEYEDQLDALTCAYVAAYLWRHGPAYTRVYGSLLEGTILTPLLSNYSCLEAA